LLKERFAGAFPLRGAYPMLLNSASLATTVADLRAGRLDLHQSIDSVI
jgi:hypothetical protein